MLRVPEYHPPDRLRTARPGARPGILLVILGLALWAVWRLDPGLEGLLSSEPNFTLMKEFFARALSPALDYEGADLPAGLPPLPLRVFSATLNTVVFAAAAMSLAVPLGIILGFCASSAWWSRPRDGAGLNTRTRDFGPGPLVYGATRLLIAAMRSVHELLWAVLFLAAFGLLDVNAVLALAIPFAGVLAKIFSEILDETPPDAALALRGAGASPLQVFLFALAPRAFPDMVSYTFYRFECALRSAAVLGFFGFPTLGFYLAASFENLYYGEVWTYMYALFALIVAVEWWSGVVRKRFVV